MVAGEALGTGLGALVWAGDADGATEGAGEVDGSGGTTTGCCGNRPPTVATASAATSSRPSAATSGTHRGAAVTNPPEPIGSRRRTASGSRRRGCVGGVVEGGRDRALGCTGRTVLEPVVEAAVEIVRCAHAVRSLGSMVRSSASMAARNAREAWWRREPAVPIGIAQDVGDLGQRQAVEVLEDEDRALVGGQPAEAALELVAVGDPAEGVRLVPADRVGVGVVGEQPDDRPAAPLAAGLRDAGPNDDPVGPGVEAVRVAQPRQLVPDRDQRLLQGILGEVVVAQDPVGGREQAAGRQAHQRLEGLLVATRRPRYEVTLHVRRLPQAPWRPGLGRS